MLKFLKWFVVSAAVVILTACGGGGSEQKDGSDSNLTNTESNFTAIDLPKIKITNGNMQEVPFDLEATVENAEEPLTVKWFLDNEQISFSDKQITEAGIYDLRVKYYQQDKYVGQTSAQLVAIKATTVATIDAKVTDGSSTVVFADENQKLTGVGVTIPEGALKSDTMISLKNSSVSFIPEAKGTPISEPLILEPAGMTFDKPVQVSIPYYDNAENLGNVVIARYSSGGVIDYIKPLYVDKVNKKIVFETEHFTTFQGTTDWIGNSADEEFIDKLNSETGYNYDMETWKAILNQNVQGKVTLYDLCSAYIENIKIKTYADNGEYTAALRVLYPDSLELDRRVKQWNEVKVGLETIDKLRGLSLDSMGELKTLLDLWGVPSINPLDYLPKYSPIDIGDGILKKLVDLDNNKYIKQYILDDLANEDNEYASFIKDVIDVSGARGLVDELDRRIKKFDKLTALSELKNYITKAKKTTNPSISLDMINIKSAYKNEKFEFYTTVKASGYGLDYLQSKPKITIYDQANKKITEYAISEEDIEYNTDDTYSFEVTFDAPSTKGNYTYTAKYSDNKNIVTQKTLSGIVNERVKTEVTSFEIYDFKIENNVAHYRVKPLFADNQKVPYWVMNNQNIAPFDNKPSPILTYYIDGNLNETRVTFSDWSRLDYVFEDKTFDLKTAVEDQISMRSATAIPAQPTAKAQSLKVKAGSSVNITLSGLDGSGNAIVGSKNFEIISNPSKGTLSGTLPYLTYKAKTDATGSDSFNFKVKDSYGNVADGMIVVRIDGTVSVNTSPNAISQTVTVNQDTPTTITLKATDIDARDTLKYSYTKPSHGKLSGSAPKLTYTPDSGYNGYDSFTFTANDGKVPSASAKVQIEVSFVEKRVVSYYYENDPKDTCTNYSDTGCEYTVQRGDSFPKEWQIKNNGNVKLSNVKLVAVPGMTDTGVQVSMTQAFPETLNVNAVGSLKLNVTVPKNARAGVHKALYKFVDRKGDLYYSNGNKAYIWYKFGVEEEPMPEEEGIPQNLKVEQTADGALLSWDAVEGATNYTPLVSLSLDGTYTSMISNNGTITDTSYLVSKSNFGSTKTFYFAVKADEGEMSEKVSFTWVDPVATDIPQNLKATLSPEGVTLDWDPVVGAESYVVMASLDGIFDGAYEEITGISTNTYFMDKSHFVDNEILYFSVGLTGGEQSERVSILWEDIEQVPSIELLAGKTYYVVGQDISDAADIWGGKTTFNADLTEMTFTGAYGSDKGGTTEVLLISIDGNRLVFVEDTEGSYGVIGENKGDYIEWTDYSSIGSIVSHMRFYFDKNKADAYAATLGGSQTASDLSALLAGKTYYIPGDESDGTLALTKIVVNADATHVVWSSLIGDRDSGEGDITIDGQFIYVDTFTVPMEFIGLSTDYINIRETYADGTTYEARWYEDQAKAEAYMNTLGGGGSFNTTSTARYTVYGGSTYFSGGFSEMQGYVELGSSTSTIVNEFRNSWKYYVIANENSYSTLYIDSVQGSNGVYYGTYTTSGTNTDSGDTWMNLQGSPDDNYVSIRSGGYILIDASNDNLSSIKLHNAFFTDISEEDR